MFKKFFLFLVCSILLVFVEISYSAPEPLVNIGDIGLANKHQNPSFVQEGKIFLVTESNQLYRVDQNASSTTKWTQIGISPSKVVQSGFVVPSSDGTTIFIECQEIDRKEQLYKIPADAASTTEWTQVGRRPSGLYDINSVVLSPDGKTVFMESNGGNGPFINEMYKVSADAKSTIAWTQIGMRPSGVEYIYDSALSPDGNTIFISSTEADFKNQMYKVSANAKSTTAWTQIGTRPEGVDRIESFVLSPDGNTVFIRGNDATRLTSQIYKVPADAKSTIAWTQIGTRPKEVVLINDSALSPDGNTIFISSTEADFNNQMYKVLVNAKSTISWTQVGEHPSVVDKIKSFVLSPDRKTIFMACNDIDDKDQMYKVLTDAKSTTSWTQVGTRSSAVGYINYFDLSPNGNTVFMACHLDPIYTDQMYKVSANASTKDDWIQVGTYPEGIKQIYYFFLSPDGNMVINNLFKTHGIPVSG